MRPPSLLVPVGAVVAAIGISMPIVTVGVQVPGNALPGVRKAIDLIPEKGLGASETQSYYLLGIVVLAVAAWLVPRVLARSNVVGASFAVAATIGAAFASARGWLIATDGPHALITGDTSFLEKNALNVLDRLDAQGILVVDPASGLWLLTAGAALLLVGSLLILRGPRRGN